MTAYAVLLATIALWPTAIEQPLTPQISRLIVRVERLTGMPALQVFDMIEFAANVALLIPFGVIIGLALGASRAWLGVLMGLTLGCLIELTQLWMLPGRFPSGLDVLANTIGSCIGAAIAFVVLIRKPLTHGSPPDSGSPPPR